MAFALVLSIRGGWLGSRDLAIHVHKDYGRNYQDGQE